jgi:RNA-directed DNA polymerase
MLTPKRQRPRKKRTDWFPTKTYVHFDGPLSRADAEKLATDPKSVSKHSFLPLMFFQKKVRRFRSTSEGPKGSSKNRPIAYASNHDGYIFSYYASILNIRYEQFVISNNIDSCVIGYRKGGSNIKHAKEAFSLIKSKCPCEAIALDISGFFDNINHNVLKNSWRIVGGFHHLPDDHFKVFKALTQFATVNKPDCLERLGFKRGTRDKKLPRPLCSIEDFRNKIRGDDGKCSSLLRVNDKKFGIPQGTPISALASNMAMAAFDVAFSDFIHSIGGEYRRYSDDILIICPVGTSHTIKDATVSLLNSLAKTLAINESKTEIASFDDKCRMLSAKPLQYLGFTFDGRKILLRSSTMSRYWRKLKRKIRWAKSQQWRARKGEILGRPVPHRRELLAAVSHLGKRNFVTGYAKRAQKIMGGAAIQKQLARHMRAINAMLPKR